MILREDIIQDKDKHSYYNEYRTSQGYYRRGGQG